jgi:NTP pyrophosphatase (non-canonical NTP hydrolase)
MPPDDGIWYCLEPDCNFELCEPPPRIRNLLRALEAKQANIDTLMLEFRPGEMSDEQRIEWAKHQKPAEERAADPFQERVLTWAQKCFWRPDALAPPQRSFRFVEEALELAQAVGTSRGDVLRLVDYVYGRPIGKPEQEMGGVLVTAAALASSLGVDMNECAEKELSRCVTNTERIRAKDMGKLQRSPLPGSSERAAGEQS